MILDQSTSKDLKTYVAIARKRPLAFGICFGKKADEVYFAPHKTRNAEMQGKEAKKEGGTPQFTFGTWKVEGKKFVFSLEGKAVAGFAKKAKKAFIKSGLSIKVVVLSPDGGVLEEDGDEEDGALEDDRQSQEDPAAEAAGPDGGDNVAPAPSVASEQDAPDPLKGKWEVSSQKIKEQLDKLSTKEGVDTSVATRLLEELSAQADGGAYEIALKGLPKVVDAMKSANTAAVEALKTGAKQAAQWEQAKTKLGPIVEDVLKESPPQARKIQSVWSMANAKVAETPPNYAFALKAVGMLANEIGAARKAIAAAAASAPAGAGAAADAGASGAGEPPVPDDAAAPSDTPDAAAPVAAGTADLSGDAAAKIQRIADEIAALRTGVIKTFTDMIPELGATVPTVWDDALKAAEAARAAAAADVGAADMAKLDTALSDLARLETLVKQAVVDKTAFNKALELFDLRMVPLGNHHLKATPEIAPEIKKLTDLRDEAVALAQTGKLTDATAKITGLETQFAATEEMADDLGHFNALNAVRKVTVDANRGVVTNDPAIDTPMRQIEKLYDDAQTDRAAKAFKDGIAKLEKIAEVYDAVAQVRDYKNTYDKHRPAAKTWIDDFATRAAPARALLADKLTELGNIYTNCDVATTKDYKKSLQVLNPFWNLKEFIKREFPIVTQYPTDLAAFEAKLAQLKAHAGKDGIKADTDLMDADLAKAKAEAAMRKYSTAISILGETTSKWSAFEARAVAYKAYIDKLAVAKPKVDALKGNAGAAALLANAETLMTDGAKQALARDYEKALTSITEAEKLADNAKAQADAQGEVEGLYDEDALNDMQANWDPAYKVFTDIRDKVVAADTGGVFTAYIAKAQLPAQEAVNAKTAGKWDDARAYLDSAIGNLRIGLAMVGSHAAYQVTRAALGTQIAAITADPPNTDNCLQKHIDAMNALLVVADNLIKPETYDYDGADAKLLEVRNAVTKAEGDGEIYKQIKINVDLANDAIRWVGHEPAASQLLLQPNIDKINVLLADVVTKRDAGDFAAALKVAEEAGLWKEHMRGDILSLRDLNTNEGPFYKDKLAGVTGAGKEAGVHRLAEAAAIWTKYEATRDAGSFAPAELLLYQAKFKIEEVELTIKLAQPYGPAKRDADDAMNLLRAATNVIMAEQINALDARLTAATIDQTKPTVRYQDYMISTRSLLAIKAEADALLANARAAQTYEPVRAAARAKLDEAKAHAHADAIDVQLTRLEGKYTNLIALADKSDFATAQTMAAEIIPAVEAAMKTASNHAILEAVNSTIGGDDDSAPWWPQVAAAKLSIKYVESQENAAVAKSYTDAAWKEIEACEAARSDDAKKSKGHLLAALEACNTADEVMSQYAFAMQEVARAGEKIGTLEGHADATYVTTQIAELKTTLDRASKTAASGQNYDAMSTDLAAVFEGVIALTALCDAHVKYVALRATDEVEPRLKELEEHEHRYAIKSNIDTMRKKLADAEAKVETHEPMAAIALLEEARAIGTAAFVMAQMRKDEPPSEDDIKEILARPNGTAELDAMIAQLEPETSREVVKVAFKLRFGCEIDNFDNKDLAPASEDTDDTQPGPNIVAFYQAMQDLPPSHTTENVSMGQFSIIEDGEQGSFYRGKEQRVVMREGDANISAPYPFGSEEAVGSPDDATTDEERKELEACQPANTDPVTFFNWNTLHEVGHAVDDQNGFMDKRAGQAAFGGWVEYGLDIAPVAQKFADKFEYDKDYIADYMAKKSNIVPATKPGGEACTDEQWEARRVAVCAHIDMAQEKKNPWESMSVAKNLAIDGVVYQESYPYKWTSYKLAARSKGITGYQFRAPGEWFSELYAAYHSGKLKNGNPAVKWLEKL
ncbi:MAG: hypothetical protein AAF754_12465 [Pseudomonadota bacterium]